MFDRNSESDEASVVTAVRRRLSRPDYMLAAIACVFALGVGLTVATPLGRVLGFGASAGLALLLIAEVLFRTPPQESDP